MKLSSKTREMFNHALGHSGLRSTRQREHIFSILLAKRDHPTADEVYTRAKEEIPSISLATVYNCLETLVECDLVKQVNFERESTRYCPNLAEHAHFYDEETGRVYDIALTEEFFKNLKTVLPLGFKATSVDLSFRGKRPLSSTTKTISHL